MPNAKKFKLPFFRTIDVQELYMDFNMLYSGVYPSSYFSFMETWKNNYSNIKICQLTRFTKCPMCEILRNSLASASNEGKPTGDVRMQQGAQLKSVFGERRE